MLEGSFMFGKGQRRKHEEAYNAKRRAKRVGVQIDKETYELIRRKRVDVEEAIRIFLSQLEKRG
jgi:hypothetical protein